MKLEHGLGALTYCTNIHKGETLDEVEAALARNLPLIRGGLVPDGSMAVGLRLSGIASEALEDEARFERLEALLAETGSWCFTINGFPFGPFHGVRVKEEVYQPDWRTDIRLGYTNRLAAQLARLLPDEEGLKGSVSTVPGTFRKIAAEDPGAVAAIAGNLVAHAAFLVDLERRTGRTVTLAIEPEPMCMLETIEETVRFFKDHLYGRDAVRRMAGLTGSSEAQAEADLRRLLGLCYDVCHAAVEFEDPAASLAMLRNAGIPVTKLQLSSALRIKSVEAASVARLEPFNDGVYLHQTVERRGNEMIRYLDLPDAFKAIDEAIGSEWRIHFHVPVFLAELEHFSTTQAFLDEILDLHRKAPISDHLEVETYTWDVLPPDLRKSDIADAIVRELAYVRDRLLA